MTNEEIKTLADSYYACNADWLNKEQEQDTKVGWRQGFAYALRQFAVSRQSELLVCDKCIDGLSKSKSFKKGTCVHCRKEIE